MPQYKEVLLSRVTLAYPSLHRPSEFQNKWRYKANFLFDKGSETDQRFRKEISSFIDSVYPTVAQKMKEDLDNVLHAPRYCYRSAYNEEDQKGFIGKMVVKASKSPKLSEKQLNLPPYEYTNATDLNPILLVRRDGVTKVTPEDDLFYGGCIVNAVVSLYDYVDKEMPSKRCVYAVLKRIQFVKDGTPIGVQESGISFDAVEEDEKDISLDDLL